MTSKPKRKAPPANFFTRLWRALLFTREFYYEVDDSPEACAEALWEQLPRSGGSFLNSHGQDISIDHAMSEHDNHYHFKIAVKDLQSRRLIATATGTIKYDVMCQCTIISGETALEATLHLPTYLVFSIFFLSTFMIEILRYKLAWFLGVCLIFGLIAYHSLKDRQWMVQSLDETLRSIQSQTYEKAKIAQPTADYAQEEISGQRKP
jgi:hypothetical protein